MPSELILASTSRYRKQELARLGVPFRAIAPDCDEDAFKRLGLAPEDLALRLAMEKAQSVARVIPGASVIGSDQLAELDGRILGKPGTAEKAIEQLLELAGKTHRLITAIVLCHSSRIFQHTDITRLSLRPLTRGQAEKYVSADSPLDCAGSYRFEAGGVRLFRAIESEDPTAIVGLPLLRLGDWLSLLGFSFP